MNRKNINKAVFKLGLLENMERTFKENSHFFDIVGLEYGLCSVFENELKVIYKDTKLRFNKILKETIKQLEEEIKEL
jgi:hypothetical protein